MTHFDVLLAKSWHANAPNEAPPAYARLVPHLRAVQKAGASIVEVAGELILRQLDLPIDPWLSRLDRALRVACLCHDLGKANDAFQKMVTHKLAPSQQPARHELLSALLLADRDSPVRRWANSLLEAEQVNDETDWLLDCIVGAVAGHHLKLDEEWKKAARALQGGCGTSLHMLLTHPDMQRLFAEHRPVHEISFSLVNGQAEWIGARRAPFNYHSHRWQDKLVNKPQWWRFAAALKALTCAADVAGSAMLPEKEPIHRWVTQTLSNRVVSDQLREVVRIRLNGQEPRLFQKQIGESTKRVTLVEAGCGTGKTAAAYLWAAQHAMGKKLFFCYPTTGTATEGFLGYVHESEVEAKLMHSRAIADLEGIAEVSDDESEDHLLRIESLSAWSPQVIVCTADTVLALVRNNRRGLYNSPAILCGAFVFDELHAYDDAMFAALLALMKALPGASFLLMSASLPTQRKSILLSHVGNIEQIPAPKDLEAIPRYEFQWAEPGDAVLNVVREHVVAGNKVLWVCNTVARAQSIFAEARRLEVNTKTYHSRFKYEDRKQRHRDVVDAFGPGERSGLLAVTTQVAEMSLDLDADVLVSEVAPISALIQRLGRLNRRVTPEQPGKPRTVLFLEPCNERPYKEDELALAKQWIEALQREGCPLSQDDLARRFHALALNEDKSLPLGTEWLDSGWHAVPGAIREGACSVSVILSEDESACRENGVNIINRKIPMNFAAWHGMSTWREFKGNLIAPEGVIDYDKEMGATWRT
ncbi:MAG: CRISPR-associated helicase Cas3' [Acidiferrobacteraceae bacterium]